LADKERLIQQKAQYCAEAALNIGKAENMIDRLEVEFKQVKEEIVSNLELKGYLSSSSVTETDKIRAILEILGEESSSAIKTVVMMIISLDMIDVIEEIYGFFVELVNFVELVSKLKSQVFVEVVSAVDLSQKLVNEIKKSVDKKTGLDVRIINTVDRDILGGIVIKIGSKVVDLSIKNKMEELKTKLKSLEIRGEEFGASN